MNMKFIKIAKKPLKEGVLATGIEHYSILTVLSWACKSIRLHSIWPKRNKLVPNT